MLYIYIFNLDNNTAQTQMLGKLSMCYVMYFTSKLFIIMATKFLQVYNNTCQFKKMVNIAASAEDIDTTGKCSN